VHGTSLRRVTGDCGNGHKVPGDEDRLAPWVTTLSPKISPVKRAIPQANGRCRSVTCAY
jgi:hypothetical protein